MSKEWSSSLCLIRGQIAEISGVNSNTLAYWLKNNLLVEVGGGDGSGSHKRFKPIQASVAAILGALQPFGLNISALKKFSSFLQHGIRVGERTSLHPLAISDAISLKKRIIRFHEGIDVQLYYSSQARDNNKEVIASSIDEIEEDAAEGRYDYAIPKDIIDFAKSLDVCDFNPLESYIDIISQMQGLDWSDPSWLIWQDSIGSWQISSQTEPSAQFQNHPQVDTAIFIAVGSIVRRVWGINLKDVKVSRLRSCIPELLRTHPQQADRLIARLREMEQEGRDG